MNRRKLLLGLALGAVGAVAVTSDAQAQSYRYRNVPYFGGRDRDDIRRRQIIRDRLFLLGDRTEVAVRNRAIGPRVADRIFERLDRVRDFLREDRNLTDSEFDRRMRDLRDAEDDLRDEVRDNRRDYRGSRYDRDYRYDTGRRYDYRYDDRYDDRYYRR